MLNPPPDQETLKHDKPIRISLDLGSDSTVAYVERRGSKAVRIDLQEFLYALANKPVLNMAGKARSHRLKSRYAANTTFAPVGKWEKRTHPVYGYQEVLPEGHARQALLDHKAYLRLGDRSADGRSAGADDRHCLFRFIEDSDRPFGFNELLPNAKLVFQTGALPKREYEALVQGGKESFSLGAIESIENQVCLILENFVRPHPALRADAGSEAPEWSECAIILTVPNTYSRYHRDILAEAVRTTLGCEVVETISESDAIVFYYINRVPQGRRETVEVLKRLDQRYLTIDIGKGTTDLTLMRIRRKDLKPEEKDRRRIDRATEAITRRVTVKVQTGRPSGGARATFIVAQFVERLVDHCVMQALDSLPASTPEIQRAVANLDGSPMRLTEPSVLVSVPLDSVLSARLLEMERLCEWYKHRLDLEDGKVTMPDYAGDLELDPLATMIAGYVRLYFTSRGTLAKDQESSVKEAVLKGLTRPNDLQAAAPGDQGLRRLQEAWSLLAQEVQAYIDENVDDVILDVANDDLQDVREAMGYKPLEDPVEALKELIQVLETDDERGEGGVRTHIVVAGQGSQFKPLRRKLEKLIADAGLVALAPQNEVSVRVEAEPTGFRERLKAGWRKRIGAESAGVPKPQAVALTDSNLKDGCAEGALLWFSDWPVMENGAMIHGQYLLKPDAETESFPVVMDELNGTQGRCVMTPERLGNLNSRFEVVFRPTRVQRSAARPLPETHVGYLDQCQSVTFARGTDGDTSLVIESNRGQKVKVETSQYGASKAIELREMLWPTDLVAPSGGAS